MGTYLKDKNPKIQVVLADPQVSNTISFNIVEQKYDSEWRFRNSRLLYRVAYYTTGLSMANWRDLKVARSLRE